MKIQPVSSPAAIQQAPPTDSKARAIEAFNRATAQSPVIDQNNISVEELGAITTKSSGQEDVVEDTDLSQSDTTEVVQETEKPAEDPALSRQFAQLARQEKALRAKFQQQEQQFKAREEALKQREAALQTPQQVDQTKYISRDMLKNDALTALAEAGVSYEELTQQIISQQPKDPRLEATINKLQAKIDALEKQNETAQKSYEDQQTQAYQAAVKQIEEDVKKLVYTDPTFETIKASKATKDVVELITETYHKDGVLLSVEEAAQQVEDYLADQYTKFANLNKIKQRMSQSSATKTPATPTQKPGQTTEKQPQPMKTLTNNTASSRQLSAKERAILAFKGQLK